MKEHHLFLKGSSGIGKSTFLLSCLKPYWSGVSGFLSQRMKDGFGETKGFCFVSLEGLKEPPAVSGLYEPDMPGLFLERTSECFQKRPEVFEGAGRDLLLRMASHLSAIDVCYLDEIGGMELSSPGFMDSLEGLLSKAPLCIGILKAAPNLSAMERRISINSYLAEERNRLELRMEKEFGCRIYPFTGAKGEKKELGRLIERLILERRR